MILKLILKVEEKERKVEEKSKVKTKKPPQKIYKEENTRRIEPVIDNELKKKIEKADIVTKDKKDGIKKERKVNKLIYGRINNDFLLYNSIVTQLLFYFRLRKK